MLKASCSCRQAPFAHYLSTTRNTLFSSALIYYLSLVVVVVLLPVLIVILYKSLDVIGLTLSQWILKAQRKDDEATAKKLQDIRKLLDTLAHDVLKHRLLGMISLVGLLDEGDGTPKSLSAQDYDDYLEEIFRLCGAKAAPHERLWTRWRNTFKEIKAIAGRTLLVPIADPLLHATDRLMLRLRAMFKLYVAKDKANAITPQALLKLDIQASQPIHKDVLLLASQCRMLIKPRELANSALTSLRLQMGRKSLDNCFTLHDSVAESYLSPAPMRLLLTSVVRLLDNALAQGKHTAQVKIDLQTDAFSNAQLLLIHVYDSSEQIPLPHQYGDGLQGISRSLAEFGCGFGYRLVEDPEFQKEAIISVPITDVEEITVKPLTWKRYVSFALIFFVVVTALVVAMYRVFGGAPIRFAGGGDTVIEFAVNVGEKLSIPLCEGGNSPRAELSISRGACWKNQCTLYNVLDKLAPCAKGLAHKDCPKRLEWTPSFEDGARQGKSYELTVKCISLGPPQSEDLKNIRLLVTRPNSTPELLLIQTQDLASQETRTIFPDKTTEFPADAKLRLRAVALDKDTDLLLYTLLLPNGSLLESYDGEFLLPLEWSQFGTWTGILQISDMVSKPKTFPIRFKANRLRPIELKNLGIWSSLSASSLNCRGMGDSRLCDLTDGEVNELNAQLWFDPLLDQVSERINFESTPDSPIEVLPHPTKSPQRLTSIVGDRWELRERETQQTLAIIELANISARPHTPLRDYGFRISVAPLSPLDPLHWPVFLTVSESSNRAPALKNLLVFSRHGQVQKSMIMSTKHIILQEYEKESDERTARASIRLFGFNANSEQNPQAKAVICENPAMAQAFEDPKIVRINENAWNLDVKLKQGCIPGLNESLSEKDKLCFLEIAYNQSNESEFLWLSLKDRPCAPRIESLELISKPEELEKNQFKWSFLIVDTDGDLEEKSIHLNASPNFKLKFSPTPKNENQHNSRISGTITGSLNCKNSPQTIIIEAQDHTKLSTRKALQPPLHCPPLASTPDKQTQFQINEGQLLQIPLLHSEDVKLRLDNSLGTIENNTYEWRANCIYGRGPHHISIEAKSTNNFGNPLQFDIYVQRCTPRIAILADDQAISLDSPISIPLNGSLTLQIDTLKADRTRFKIEVTRNNPDPQLQIQNEQNPPTLTLTCKQNTLQESIQVLALPIDNNDPDFLPAQPLNLTIHCGSPDLETQV